MLELIAVDPQFDFMHVLCLDIQASVWPTLLQCEESEIAPRRRGGR